MPSVKRRASTRTTAVPAKKARLVEEPESALASRPKRKTVGTPQYKLTRTYKQADTGPKVEEIASPEPAAPKRRGRPPKDSTIVPSTPKNAAHSAPPKPRGRPRLDATSAKPATKQAASANVAKGAPTGKKRGRPSKAEAAAASDTLTKTEKKKKTVTSTNVGQVAPKRKPGRPSKSAIPDGLAKSDLDETASDDGGGDEVNDDGQETHQYWLMKAEPNDRYENGVNVKFSIDDLAAASVPEPWDGVRNFAARNNMRAMRKNDLAFFYHSNCQVPGVVGVMRVVQEHTTDQTAFDPKHPYYDPKSSPANPKWDCVHVAFVKKFDTSVTLKSMQEDKAKSGRLANMQLLKMGRLSVSAVKPEEWRHILSMANEDARLGETETEVPDADGYESDTDGEAEDGPGEELNGDAVPVGADITTAENGKVEEADETTGGTDDII